MSCYCLDFSNFQYQQDNEQSPFKLKTSTRLFNEWNEL